MGSPSTLEVRSVRVTGGEWPYEDPLLVFLARSLALWRAWSCWRLSSLRSALRDPRGGLDERDLPPLGGVRLGSAAKELRS